MGLDTKALLWVSPVIALAGGCGDFYGDDDLAPLHTIHGTVDKTETGTRYVVLGWVPSTPTSIGQSVWVKGPHAELQPDETFTLPLWELPPREVILSRTDIALLTGTAPPEGAQLAIGVLVVVDVLDGEMPNNWADIYASPDVRVRFVDRFTLVSYAYRMPTEVARPGFGFMASHVLMAPDRDDPDEEAFPEMRPHLVLEPAETFEFKETPGEWTSPMLRCNSAWDWPAVEHIYPGLEGDLPQPGEGTCRGCDRRLEVDTCRNIGGVLCSDCELIVHRLLDSADPPPEWPCGLQAGDPCEDADTPICSASSIWECVGGQWSQIPLPSYCTSIVTCCGEFCEVAPEDFFAEEFEDRDREDPPDEELEE